MIPEENRFFLIKNLKAGWDIRNACSRSKISRALLYEHYKEDPDFKVKVRKTIQAVLDRKDKTVKMSERHALRKNKQALRNRTGK